MPRDLPSTLFLFGITDELVIVTPLALPSVSRTFKALSSNMERNRTTCHFQIMFDYVF